jgi:hypothetical protein
MTKKPTKKETKEKAVQSESQVTGEIHNREDLQKFLTNLRDRMADGVVAPIYALSMMNRLFSEATVYPLFDAECKELGRDIWLRIKASNLQVRNPVLLFGEENGADATR